MSKKNEQVSLFNEIENNKGPIYCLGLTFNNEDERREYFREELRKKLPELKKIEGFPKANDEDIIALSDPPYYTACPNPFLPAILESWKHTNYLHRTPFVGDVSEGKYDPIYKFHPYSTKVPHKAIMRYILHYTSPGDIILDSFSGTGSTGIASQLCNDKTQIESLGYKVDNNGEILEENQEGSWVPFSKIGTRKVILNELSPAASFITYNYNSEFLASEYDKLMGDTISQVREEYEWMFYTYHKDIKTKEEILEILGNPHSNENIKELLINKKNSFGYVNYVAWSDVFVCPECLNEIVFWEAAVDQEKGKIFDKFNCPSCSKQLTKRGVERAFTSTFDKSINETIRQSKRVPVLISYTYGKERFVKKPDKLDLEIIKLIENTPLPSAVPTNRMPVGKESRRNDSSGITHVHHFYTRRNAIILGAFYEKADRIKTGFSLTRVAARITQMYGLTYQSGVWGAGGGPLSGTLYIPSLIKELNMINQLENSVKQQLKKNNQFNNENFVISTGSSTNLEKIKDDSIDYIFLDPPFGGNLMYSELNFLWESWLKVRTNNSSEAIVNSSQEKGIEEYKKLMTDCFKEAYRVLKPSKWITIEFSNTQASVWNAIQSSIQDAGFIVANVSALDKQKGSFKAITTPTAVKQDLIISAYKPDNQLNGTKIEDDDIRSSVWEFVQSHLQYLPTFKIVNGEVEFINERDPRILYDRLISYYVRKGLNIPISSQDFLKEIKNRFSERDGMIFLQEQANIYDKKQTTNKKLMQMNLFITDENSAIEWMRQKLTIKPQTRQDLHPNFIKEIQHIDKHELLPELDSLLEQNFLMYDGKEDVPSQIHKYLSSNYKDLRGLEKSDSRLKEKAKHRWYVPDPNKQADLEKLREKSLLREFDSYKTEIEGNKKKLKQFRTEAVRTGFKKAWSEKDYETIVKIGERLPEKVLQEDDKLLMYFDNAQIRLGV